MFSARDLLGQLVDHGMSSQTTSTRIGHAVGPHGVGGADSPLAGLLGSQGGGQGQSGGLGGIMGMAQGLFGDASRSVKGGNPLALGGLGALAGAVLGGGGKSMGGALGGGALALLGTLAYQAMSNKGEAPAANTPEELARHAPLGLREPQDAAEEAELERRAMLIIRAMINAAKADGDIDKSEIERIAGKLDEAGLGQDAHAFIANEMGKPFDPDGIIREVQDKELALEVYAASLLAIEVDTQAEERYLDGLAKGLGLDPAMVRFLHQRMGVANTI